MPSITLLFQKCYSLFQQKCCRCNFKSINCETCLGAVFSAIKGEFQTGGRVGLYPITVLLGSAIAYFLLFSVLFKKMKDMSKLWLTIGNFGILPAALSLTLIVQGYVCCKIGLDMLHTDMERGIAGVMAAVLTISGATWGLVVGIVVYIILFGNFKNPVAVEAKTEA